jgi:predicted DCC family thiol-disulfide oxidoreductase YuxK
MTTIEQVSEKFLAYDGDCPMCTSTIALLLRLNLVRPEQTRSNHVLEGAEWETVRAAGIRNQLVVLDPHTGETRSGSDALLWIIGDNLGHPWWVRVLGWPGMRHALRWGYETISYNRRVISPPRHQVVCDCEPEVTLARRLMLAVPVVILTFIISALFASAVFYAAGLGDALAGALFSTVALATSWAAIGAAAIVLLRGQQRIDYLAHLAVTFLVGALVALPASLVVGFVPRDAAIAIASSLAGASTWLMVAMQRRRVTAIGLSARWLWAGIVAIGAGFLLVAYFYFWQGPK